MAKMYIANCTNQVQDFQYRLPEKNKTMKQAIAIGEQILLPMDLAAPDIEAILEQHSPYGMISVQEIDRAKAFVGICYSLDRKVDMNRVMYVVEHNYKVLDERGRVIRKEAAVAINNAIEGEGNKLASLETTVEEVPTKGQDSRINETVRVTKHEGPGGPASKPSAGRRRAA